MGGRPLFPSASFGVDSGSGSYTGIDRGRASKLKRHNRPKSLQTLMKIVALIALVLLLHSETVFALGGDYPPGLRLVADTNWPSGLAELLQSPRWVHGHFVNMEDLFFYAGDTAAFQRFLDAYAALPIASHTLRLCKGSGLAKSPWGARPGLNCDWKLYMAPEWRIAMFEETRTDLKEVMIRKHSGYIVTLDLWVGGGVDFPEVKVPSNVTVTDNDEMKSRSSTDSLRLEDASITNADRPRTTQTVRESRTVITKVMRRPESESNISATKVVLVTNAVMLTPSPSLNEKLFGPYYKALLAQVRERWSGLLEQKDYRAKEAGRVVLEFQLHQDGRVTDLNVKESTVGEFLALLCQKNVLDSCPFASWSTEMRQSVGAEHCTLSLSFRFPPVPGGS
jgi:hypothetical protein